MELGGPGRTEKSSSVMALISCGGAIRSRVELSRVESRRFA